MDDLVERGVPGDAAGDAARHGRGRRALVPQPRRVRGHQAGVRH